MSLENSALVFALKRAFAPDGGAEREHAATIDSLGFGTIHYALVRCLAPERALAIGSRYGFVPSVIALALRENGLGRLDFVDANFDDAAHGFATAYGGVGAWSGDAGERFRRFGLRAEIDVHVRTTQSFFSEARGPYGYVYIDGDHSFEGCRFDFQEAASRLSPGAVIALHDSAISDPPFGVARVIDELDTREYSVLRLPVLPGLALVQRR